MELMARCWHEIRVCWLKGRHLMQDELRQFLKRTLATADELMVMANRCEVDLDLDSCHVVCGVIRDCAYAIRATADREMRRFARQLASGAATKDGGVVGQRLDEASVIDGARKWLNDDKIGAQS